MKSQEAAKFMEKKKKSIILMRILNRIKIWYFRLSQTDRNKFSYFRKGK